MLLVDANVLLHAANAKAPQHRVARGWLAGALSGQETVAFAWTVVLAFLRLSTHPAVFPRPMGVDEATGLVERWLSAPPAVLVDPTPRHLPVLRGLLSETGTGGNLVGDAHLAALALESGATVVSFDRDFGRFEGLRQRVPAAPPPRRAR